MIKNIQYGVGDKTVGEIWQDFLDEDFLIDDENKNEIYILNVNKNNFNYDLQEKTSYGFEFSSFLEELKKTDKDLFISYEYDKELNCTKIKSNQDFTDLISKYIGYTWKYAFENFDQEEIDVMKMEVLKHNKYQNLKEFKKEYLKNKNNQNQFTI